MNSSVCITEQENWIVATDVSTNIASQGKTTKEALVNLKEALELYYEGAEHSNAFLENFIDFKYKK
jgi:predicted RNase H-like HicB family nuclease